MVANGCGIYVVRNPTFRFALFQYHESSFSGPTRLAIRMSNSLVAVLELLRLCRFRETVSPSLRSMHAIFGRRHSYHTLTMRPRYARAYSGYFGEARIRCRWICRHAQSTRSTGSNERSVQRNDTPENPFWCNMSNITTSRPARGLPASPRDNEASSNRSLLHHGHVDNLFLHDTAHSTTHLSALRHA